MKKKLLGLILAVIMWAIPVLAETPEPDPLITDQKEQLESEDEMPYIPKVKVGGTVYEIKDSVARPNLSYIDAFDCVFDNYYFRASTHAFTALNDYYCGVAFVKPGEIFDVSGCGYGNTYYLWSFTDASFNILSHSEVVDNDYKEHAVAIAPEGAVYLIVNLGEGHGKNKLKCHRPVTDEIIRNIACAEGKKSAFIGTKYTNRFYKQNTNSWQMNSTMVAYVADCVEGDVFVANGITNGELYNAIVFFDSNGSVIKRYPSFTGGSVNYEHVYVIAPSGATKIVVQGSNEGQSVDFVSCKKILNDAEYENLLLDKDPLPGGTLYKNQYFSTSGKYVSLENYNCYKIHCSEGDEFVTTTYGWSTIYYGWSFVGEDGQIITHSENESSIGKYFINQTITAPSGAAMLVLNFGDNPLSKIKCVSKDTVVSSNEATRTWLSGKKIVWFGTSIPSGQVNGSSYPQLVASELGAIVYNESVGSSPMSLYNPALESQSRALSLTYAEKQASSWWNSLSDEQKTIARDTSFDYKVTKYLTGGSVGPVDLYVFDHGYNDYNSDNPEDYLTEPDDPNDKSYPLGAANFLVNAILQDNPNACIVWIGHYENALLDPTDHQSCGKPTAELQELISEKYGIPLCKVWESTGWSNANKITTTGYWENGIWQNSGGPSRQDYVKNCAFADGIHPHTDRSGKATRKIANIIAKWLKNLY